MCIHSCTIHESMIDGSANKVSSQYHDDGFNDDMMHTATLAFFYLYPDRKLEPQPREQKLHHPQISKI